MFSNYFVLKVQANFLELKNVVSFFKQLFFTCEQELKQKQEIEEENVMEMAINILLQKH